MSALWNNMKTAILLSSLTALLMIIGVLVGGQSGLIVGFVIALVMNFVSYWFSDKIVLMMYHAKPVTQKQVPNLWKIVDEVRKEANLPMPKVYVIPTMTPNAFATGRNPKHAVVAVTQGLIEMLSHNELKGVVAHEVSHIKNRDILIGSVAATIASVIGFVAMMARWAAIFGGGGGDKENNNIFTLLIIGIVTPIIAMLIQLAISRSREYLADESGARIVKDPTYLADALLKIEKGNKLMPLKDAQPATAHMFIMNPFSAKGIMGLLSTHPPVEERVKKLKAMKF
jgi:heat shock protein HtpX